MRKLFSTLFPRGQDALPWAVSVLAAVLLLAIWLEAGVRLDEQEQTAMSCVSAISASAYLPLQASESGEAAAIAAALKHSRQVQILRAILGSVLIVGAALVIVAVLARKQRLYVQLENAQSQKQILIEQLQQERNRAFQLASLDYLTGIPNRMEFVARTARDYELVARLKRAIADGELQLHYQSRVRLADFSVAGLEALVRWQHPEHGLIYPGEFIPLAEAHDLIVPLGEWVICQACRQLRHWLDEGVPAVPVAINISARQLNGIGLAECVCQALREHALPPEMLEIEVTESCFFDPDGPGLRELRQLEQLGMKISLDDYGTGFSSLNQLKRLPVNTIKIDRSFIKDIRNDANDMLIVSSTIILAHNLGLSVVAEGVETSEQLVHLKTAGCDEVQGFYFHRPVQAREVPAILARSPVMRAVVA